jgi:hypothetical protein
VNWREEGTKPRTNSAGRVKAKEKQRDEELKAKKKANIIRTTGRVPKTCFCWGL